MGDGVSYFISFLDSKSRRKVSYDEPREIKILDSGAVRIRCADGFHTVVSPDEWQKMEVDKFEHETED